MRNQKLLSLLALLVFFTGLSVMAYAACDDVVKCPVSGKEVKKSEAPAKAEYEGKTYYFCCESCKEPFMKDPEKYTSEKTSMMKHDECCSDETVDPVCGMKIKKSEAKAKHTYKGKTYYFCMEGCKAKFLEDPDKYHKVSEGKSVCPVSGKGFVKKEKSPSLEYEGKTYYFCCPDCKEKFAKNPDKYVK